MAQTFLQQQVLKNLRGMGLGLGFHPFFSLFPPPRQYLELTLFLLLSTTHLLNGETGK